MSRTQLEYFELYEEMGLAASYFEKHNSKKGNKKNYLYYRVLRREHYVEQNRLDTFFNLDYDEKKKEFFFHTVPTVYRACYDLIEHTEFIDDSPEDVDRICEAQCICIALYDLSLKYGSEQEQREFFTIKECFEKCEMGTKEDYEQLAINIKKFFV